MGTLKIASCVCAWVELGGLDGPLLVGKMANRLPLLYMFYNTLLFVDWGELPIDGTEIELSSRYDQHELSNFDKYLLPVEDNFIQLFIHYSSKTYKWEWYSFVKFICVTGNLLLSKKRHSCYRKLNFKQECQYIDGNSRTKCGHSKIFNQVCPGHTTHILWRIETTMFPNNQGPHILILSCLLTSQQVLECIIIV